METDKSHSETTAQQDKDTSARPVATGFYSRIDRDHPIGGEMSDILQGLIRRVRLPWLLHHHARLPVLAIFSFINGCISIGLMSILAVLTHSPFIFPSLG